ncbi:MAG: hypothetical protein FD130_1408 [Halothiobacillaceae bacterium]|nr:MAG: hypothetical protein FD130_1408 [Halothiobacillaceae bacterium]
MAIALGLASGGYAAEVRTRGVVSYANEGFTHLNELADFNGDGLIDILRVLNADQDLATIQIHYGKPDGSYATVAALNIPQAVTSRSKSFRYFNQVIDMNGDGIMDIFTIEYVAGNGSQTHFKVLYGSRI